MNNPLTILRGNALDMLRTLPDESVQCIVTSPPYWGLRSYLRKDDPDKEHEIGQERTPGDYVAKLVAVFAEARRVLKKDGTCWLNLGDSYANDGKWGGETGGKQAYLDDSNRRRVGREKRVTGLKPKDLAGIPWRVAFALQEDGWWLRSEITWCKRAPMPESVTDRPTSATEKIFLLSKSEHYHYDADAVRTPPSEAMLKQVAEGYNGEALKGFEAAGVQNASSVKSRIIANARKKIEKVRGHERQHHGLDDLSKAEQMAFGSNMRNYWLLGTKPMKGEHYATYPPEIPRRCILAATKPNDVVLDPFGGSGTTGKVAIELRRKSIIIELNRDYIPIIEERTSTTIGLGI